MERGHLEDLRLNGRIILKRMFKICCGEGWAGMICLTISQLEEACECGNEISAFIRCGEFLE
jgi:hypothetical protein